MGEFRDTVVNDTPYNKVYSKSQASLKKSMRSLKKKIRYLLGEDEWSKEEDDIYTNYFKKDITIVIFIRAHGCILSNNVLQTTNVHWYAPLPYYNVVISRQDIDMYNIDQFRILYRENNRNIQSNGIVNHFKVLQAFLSIKMFPNTTINDYNMDKHNTNLFTVNKSMIDRKKQAKAVNVSKNIITKNQYREIMKDKHYSNCNIYIVYMNTNDSNAYRYITKSNINEDEATLLVEKNGKQVKETTLSTIVDKLQGRQPFIIDESGKKLFVKFDNIFIYDQSCNITCYDIDIGGDDNKLCSNTLMPGDVEGKHSFFDYQKRLRKVGVSEYTSPSDETVLNNEPHPNEMKMNNDYIPESTDVHVMRNTPNQTTTPKKSINHVTSIFRTKQPSKIHPFLSNTHN
jgi:hypothetical protein